MIADGGNTRAPDICGDNLPVQGVIQRKWVVSDNFRRIPEGHIRQGMSQLLVVLLCLLSGCKNILVPGQLGNPCHCRKGTGLENQYPALLCDAKLNVQIVNAAQGKNLLHCGHQRGKLLRKAFYLHVPGNVQHLSGFPAGNGIGAAVIIVIDHKIWAVMEQISGKYHSGHHNIRCHSLNQHLFHVKAFVCFSSLQIGGQHMGNGCLHRLYIVGIYVQYAVKMSCIGGFHAVLICG